MPGVDGALATRMIRFAEKEASFRPQNGAGQPKQQRVPIIAMSTTLVEDNRFEYIQNGYVLPYSSHSPCIASTRILFSSHAVSTGLLAIRLFAFRSSVFIFSAHGTPDSIPCSSFSLSLSLLPAPFFSYSHSETTANDLVTVSTAGS